MPEAKFQAAAQRDLAVELSRMFAGTEFAVLPGLLATRPKSSVYHPLNRAVARLPLLQKGLGVRSAGKPCDY